MMDREIMEILPSDSTSRWTPLAFGCILPTTRADLGLSPFSDVCRKAHKKKRDNIFVSLFRVNYLIGGKIVYMITKMHFVLIKNISKTLECIFDMMCSKYYIIKKKKSHYLSVKGKTYETCK